MPPEPFFLEQVICRHQHPLEWSSPTPRQIPCESCIFLAIAISRVFRVIYDPAGNRSRR